MMKSYTLSLLCLCFSNVDVLANPSAAAKESFVQVSSKVARKGSGFDGFGDPNEFNRDDEDEVDAGQPNMPPADDASDDDANMVTEQDVDDDDAFVQLGRSVHTKKVRGDPVTFDEGSEEEEDEGFPEDLDEDAAQQAHAYAGPTSEFDATEEVDYPDLEDTSEEEKQASLGSDSDVGEVEEENELDEDNEESKDKHIAIHQKADFGSESDEGDIEDEEEEEGNDNALPSVHQVVAEINQAARQADQEADADDTEAFIQAASKKADRFLSK